MRNLKSNLLYWIPTVLIAMNWTFGGVTSLMRTRMSMEVYHRLGYPDYFATLLGTAQLLGVAAILLPVPRTFREWAYAGLVFDATSAIVSLLFIGTPPLQCVIPFIALLFVLASYRAWRGRLERSVA